MCRPCGSGGLYAGDTTRRALEATWGFIFMYQLKFWAPHLRDTTVLLKELTWNDSAKFAKKNVTTTHERMLAEVLGYCSRMRGFQFMVFGIEGSP